MYLVSIYSVNMVLRRAVTRCSFAHMIISPCHPNSQRRSAKVSEGLRPLFCKPLVYDNHQVVLGEGRLYYAGHFMMGARMLYGGGAGGAGELEYLLSIAVQ